MLIMKQLPNGVYKLTQHIHSFHRSTVEVWYYDIEKQLISEKENFPDNLQTRSMTGTDNVWFYKYYLKLLEE